MARFYDSVFPFHGRPFFAKRSNMMTNILKKMRREVEEAVKLKNNSGNVFGFFFREAKIFCFVPTMILHQTK